MAAPPPTTSPSAVAPSRRRRLLLLATSTGPAYVDRCRLLVPLEERLVDCPSRVGSHCVHCVVAGGWRRWVPLVGPSVGVPRRGARRGQVKGNPLPPLPPVGTFPRTLACLLLSSIYSCSSMVCSSTGRVHDGLSALSPRELPIPPSPSLPPSPVLRSASRFRARVGAGEAGESGHRASQVTQRPEQHQFRGQRARRRPVASPEQEPKV